MFDILEEEEARGTEKEVFQALNSIDSDKAPGPEGFTIDFFQKCWNVVKGNIMRFSQFSPLRNV